MARTESTMLPLDTLAPDFMLQDVNTHKRVSFKDCQGSQGTLIMFICNHCPFVKHIVPKLTELCHDYLTRGVGVVAINANDVVHYPDDAPDKMAMLATQHAWQFPYLFDETQDTAKAYKAACTPDFFLFDSQQRLVYRGQFDASTPGNGIPVTGDSLQAALDALIAGQPAIEPQKPSVGCNIKWRE